MATNDSSKPVEVDNHTHHPTEESVHLSTFAVEQMKRDFQEKKSGIGADTNQAGIEKFIGDPSNRERVDYAHIAKESGRGPILIGDTHRSLATKPDFIASLPELKRAGVQEVDFELLPAGNPMQDQLDNYAKQLKNPLSSPEIIKAEHDKLVEYFLNIWDGGPDEAIRLKMAEKLTDMVESAMKAGLRPVGIEPPVEHFHKSNEGTDFFHHGLERLTAADQPAFDRFWDSSTPQEISQCKEHMQSVLQRSGWSPEQTEKFGRILDQMKAGIPPLNMSGLEVPRRERGDNYDDPDYEGKLLAWRNSNWRQIIEGQVHSGKKVALFAGGGHFGHAEQDETISGLLGKAGIDSITVMKTGGDIDKIRSANEAFAKKTNQQFKPMPPEVHSSAATQAGLSNERFAYRLDPSVRREADYVIHLPIE